MVASATNGASDVVSLLLEKGARAGERDVQGTTALSAATMADHAAAVRLLLAAGADLRSAVELATDVAGIAVARRGAQASYPERSEVPR